MLQVQPGSLDYKGKPGEIGVLLIHGFTGTTRELDPLARYLHQYGYTVHAPLLKGHGTTPEEMRKTTWIDWLVSAQEGYRYLKEHCREVVVGGLSMGGLLALKLAQQEEVRALISMCAPLVVRDRRIGLARYFSPFIPYIKRKRQKAEHIESKLYIYDRTPVTCVASLKELMDHIRRLLPGLRVPILIVQSVNDETVHPISASLLYDEIGSQDKTLHFFDDSTHIITLDKEQHRLNQLVVKFIQRIKEEPFAYGSNNVNTFFSRSGGQTT